MQANRAFAFAFFTLALVSVASAQRQPRQQAPVARPAPRQPGAIAAEVAIQITNGWALLTEGRPAEAAAKADQVLVADPRSLAALELAIEASLARGGALAGLDRYERWLGQRTLEEPAVLSRIGLAMLHEETAQRQDVPARTEALIALANEGDRAAQAELQQGGSGPTSTRALASAGDGRAVKKLIAQLDGGSPAPDRDIEALGDSGNPAAVGPIVRYLGDSRDEVRGAAAQALGKLGDRRVIAQISPLVSDRSSFVRIRAAGALERLGDNSGLPMLQQLIADESPAVRLAAAQAMSNGPDTSWLTVVRQLASDPNPEIRAGAAHLLAPHDPELSLKVLESLAADENPAIRDLASRAVGDVVTSDLTTLRRLFRTSQRLTRVRTAVRVLALTR